MPIMPHGWEGNYRSGVTVFTYGLKADEIWEIGTAATLLVAYCGI